MPISFDERLDMLQKASKAWVELQRAIRPLSDTDLTRPNTIGTWTGKDLLTHLANWEELGIGVLEDMEDGGQPEWPHADELDAVNAEMLEPWRGRSLDEIRAYLEQTHFALMDLAERSQAITPHVLLSVTANHYAQHLDDLRRLRKKQ